MKLRLVELQPEDGQMQKIRAEKLGGNWEDFDRILHHQGMVYVPEIIKTKLISRNYNHLLAGYFGIKKMQELVIRMYYWETLRHNVEIYVRDCNVCLASKTVKPKPYGNLQKLPVPTYHWKD